jgi:glucose-1-phosphate thymidylyltransferase
MMRYHGLLLAAGKGARLGSSSEAIPKALVRVGHETLIEHNLKRLVDAGLEHIVAVVGFQADAVVAHLAGSPHRDRVEFVRQEEPLGTGHAVAVSRGTLRSEPFVLCYGDNYTPYRLDALIRVHEEQRNAVTLALFHAEDPTRHGIMQVEGPRIVSIVERPKKPVGNLAFAGMGVFESDIYDAVQNVRQSDSGEYYLTDAIMDLVHAGRVVGFDVLSSWRVNVNSLADLERARSHYRAHPAV